MKIVSAGAAGSLSIGVKGTLASARAGFSADLSKSIAGHRPQASLMSSRDGHNQVLEVPGKRAAAFLFLTFQACAHN